MLNVNGALNKIYIHIGPYVFVLYIDSFIQDIYIYIILDLIISLEIFASNWKEMMEPLTKKEQIRWLEWILSEFMNILNMTLSRIYGD